MNLTLYVTIGVPGGQFPCYAPDLDAAIELLTPHVAERCNVPDIRSLGNVYVREAPPELVRWQEDRPGECQVKTVGGWIERTPPTMLNLDFPQPPEAANHIPVMLASGLADPIYWQEPTEPQE